MVVKTMEMEKALLDFKETCAYLGLGKTKIREMMTDNNCSWSLKIGRNWYANKQNLDAWLNRQCRIHHG